MKLIDNFFTAWFCTYTKTEQISSVQNKKTAFESDHNQNTIIGGSIQSWFFTLKLQGVYNLSRLLQKFPKCYLLRYFHLVCFVVERNTSRFFSLDKFFLK